MLEDMMGSAELNAEYNGGCTHLEVKESTFPATIHIRCHDVLRNVLFGVVCVTELYPIPTPPTGGEAQKLI
jgi:hypothetical protein